jgi:hypothetical protein
MNIISAKQATNCERTGAAILKVDKGNIVGLH